MATSQEFSTCKMLNNAKSIAVIRTRGYVHIETPVILTGYMYATARGHWCN
jgi:hypothetical protein